jgi:serine/threonine protein kinase
MLGKLLDGRYQVVQVLGGGGFGRTYIAQDTRRPGNPRCVVKHLKPASNEPIYLQTAKRLFYSEAETLEQLGKHSQIPQLLAYFEENQEFYLVQEFIIGHSLSTELQPGYYWSESQVIEFLQDVLGILAFVHSYSVIHRDIKPDNLIRRVSDGKLVLIDFGAVKQVRSQIAVDYSQMNATVAIGTPGYMPSEQGLGRPRPNSDIYALGMIAIQALTGLYPTQLQEDPTTGEMVWQQRVQVSPGFASILSKMVRYDYRDRYQSANEVLQAIAQLSYSFPPTQQLTTPPIAPTQVSPVLPPQQHTPSVATPKKRPLLPFVFGGIIVGVSVGVAIAYLNSVPTPSPISPQNLGSNPLPLNPTSTNSSNEFDKVQFPQASCGDSRPTNSASTIQFYPVFLEYSESNLQTVKSNFCADAYRTNRTDTGAVAIQVASFTNRSRAELFRDFMNRKLGSGEVGEPTVYSTNGSTDTLSQTNCSVVVVDPDSPLNVRSTPDTKPDNIVGTVEDGTRLSVVAEQNGWLQINSPLQGWVAKNRTKRVCQ